MGLCEFFTLSLPASVSASACVEQIRANISKFACANVDFMKKRNFLKKRIFKNRIQILKFDELF